MSDPRTPVFDALRTLLGGSLTPSQVSAMNACLDAMGAPSEAVGGRRAINAPGLQLIKDSEGLELVAYRDPVGILTIGYGSTGKHVTPGKVITEAQAEELLRSDLRRFEDAVAKLAPDATDNQFAAMVSLAFNVGEGAFEGSTLLKKHLAGDHAGTANEFAKWRFAGGKELPGLVKRRAREAALYRKP